MSKEDKKDKDDSEGGYVNLHALNVQELEDHEAKDNNDQNGSKQQFALSNIAPTFKFAFQNLGEETEKLEPSEKLRSSDKTRKSKKRVKKVKREQSISRSSTSAVHTSKNLDGEKNKVEATVSVLTARRLERLSHFHGMLPEEDINAMCIKDGDFVLHAKPEVDEKGEIVTALLMVSVKWEGILNSFQLNFRDDQRTVNLEEKLQFDSIEELIKTYREKKFPLGEVKAVLRRPIHRKNWQLRHKNIQTGRRLGEGAFGEVFTGWIKTRPDPFRVAVKVPKMDEALKKTVLDEVMNMVRIQREFQHPNVVRLFGVAYNECPLLIVTEYLNGGSLYHYLQQNPKKLDAEIRTAFCFDIAFGLWYLHFKKCVHGNLNLRNCLLDSNIPIVKIGNFGLCSKGRGVKTLDGKTPTTLRWLAPETQMDGICTKESDVWSFAIVVQMIFNSSHDPFGSESLTKIKAILSQGDYRPKLPRTINDQLSYLMYKCWKIKVKERPSAGTLVKVLREFAFISRFEKVPPIKAYIERYVNNGPKVQKSVF